MFAFAIIPFIDVYLWRWEPQTAPGICCAVAWMAKVSPPETRPSDHSVCFAWNKNTKFGFGTDFKLKSARQINRVVIGLREQTNRRRWWFFLSWLSDRNNITIHEAPPPHLFLLQSGIRNPTPSICFPSASKLIYISSSAVPYAGAFLRAQIIAVSGNRSNICLHNRMHSTELIEIDSR